MPRAGARRAKLTCFFAVARISRLRCGRSSMAEHQLPKLNTRVRFPSPAPAPEPLIRLRFRGSFMFSSPPFSLLAGKSESGNPVLRRPDSGSDQRNYQLLPDLAGFWSGLLLCGFLCCHAVQKPLTIVPLPPLRTRSRCSFHLRASSQVAFYAKHGSVSLCSFLNLQQ